MRRGGSFLCADNYCRRFLPAARDSNPPRTHAVSYVRYVNGKQILDQTVELHEVTRSRPMMALRLSRSFFGFSAMNRRP